MAKIVLLYAVAIAYSAVRYILFTPQNLANLPVFVVNKGVSMAAAFCFVLAFWKQLCRERGAMRGTEPAVWFRAGMFGAIWHVPMSLTILRPSYFPEFFADSSGRMSFSGEVVFMFGSLSAGGIYLLSRSQWTASQRWWLSVATIAAIFGHTLCMGFARGLNITQRHAYLPPMWLLSVIGIACGACFLFLSRPAREAEIVDATKTQSSQ